MFTRIPLFIYLFLQKIKEQLYRFIADISVFASIPSLTIPWCKNKTQLRVKTWIWFALYAGVIPYTPILPIHSAV